MDKETYSLHALKLQGFRAYLKPKHFDFSQKKCLAIFAPNGSGKSSLIDALEFMFSKDGTLARLGLRAINNQAGAVALAHNLAEEREIAPRVTIEFARGKDRLEGVREAGGGKRVQPAAAALVKSCFAVDPIIRGYELRRFVEEHTAEQRYADFAQWLQLDSFVEVQKNLRALRQAVKTAAEDSAPFNRIDRDLGRETGNALTAWDARQVLAYVNETVLAPLGEALVLTALDASDPAIQIVSARMAAEEQRAGLAGLRQLRAMVAGVYEEKADASTGAIVAGGAVPAFEAAVAKTMVATAAEAAERAKAEKAAFSALWKVAEPLFAAEAPMLDACPICATPMADTAAGSAEAIRDHLAKHLGDLEEYARAKKSLDEAQAAQTRVRMGLIAELRLLAKFDDGCDAAKAASDAYLAALEAWTAGPPPASDLLMLALRALLVDLDERIAGIEAKQGEFTHAKAKAKIERLLELQAEHTLAMRTRTEMEALSRSLTDQAAFISAAIRMQVQALLNTLQDPVNAIYAQIQGARAVPVRLELPREDETNQQRLNLLIDFAENRLGVQPGGFLSDSQIHSVALALRIAAIKQFNVAAPFIALDDVVTSYDADHRRAVVGMLAEQCADCQLIVTTHDERFFNYLKDQLAAKDWQFARITRLDPEFGPIFADHRITEEMIEARWRAGESAANEMRQAEEEWLLSICRDFGVDVRIRSLDKPYSFERSELASALAAFLKGAKLEPKPVPGVQNRFLASLQQGVVENFGSHFQDGPYGDGSLGDERARWQEFKAFRSQFACPKCLRVKFQRPHTLKKPLCAHPACEAQFEFSEAMAAGQRAA